MFSSIIINNEQRILIPYELNIATSGHYTNTGFTSYFTWGNYGEFYFDEIAAAPYIIQSWNFHTKQRVQLIIEDRRSPEIFSNLKDPLRTTHKVSPLDGETMETGRFLFQFNKTDEYQFELDENSYYEIFSIQFLQETLKHLVLSAFQLSTFYVKVAQGHTTLYPPGKSIRLSTPMKHKIEKMINISQADSIIPGFTASLTQELLSETIRTAFPFTPNIRETSSRQEKVQQATGLLEKNLDERYNTVHLAKTVGINVWSLQKGFKDIFGISIQHYALKKKLEKAVCLLLTSTTPEKDIALTIGYSDLSAMIKTFQRELGFAPGDLRKI
jgi:AraC-like DNA-binding protein